jgi:hypothetical protein
VRVGAVDTHDPGEHRNGDKPIVGSEQQSQDLVKYMLKEFEEEPGKIGSRICSAKAFTNSSTRGLLPTRAYAGGIPH